MDLINTSFLHNKEVVMVIRLVVAAILGGIVGIERGSGDRPAGFRTHILVCVGSALFMLVSLYGFDDVYPQTAKLEEDIGQRRDSARIAAQVVSGIGFFSVISFCFLSLYTAFIFVFASSLVSPETSIDRKSVV